MRLLSSALLCLILTGLIGSIAPASAQTADLKSETVVVAVVDVQRILAEAKAAQSIQTAINAHKERLEKGLEAENNALKAEEEALRKQRTVLAPEVFDERRRKLERSFADLRRRSQEAGASLAQARNVALNKLRNEMARVMTKIMEEKKITITLARKSVLVYDERLNITDEVMKSLDAALPAVDVTLEPVGQ